MDYTPASRRLSEISHLFLSDVRQKQTGQESRPARVPPGGFRGDVSVDLTPEEFAQVMRPGSANDSAFKPLRAVIAHHLGEAMTEHVRDLAVAVGDGGPVGVIYAASAGVRVCVVDAAAADAGTEEAAEEPLDVQRLREAIVELNQDVCQWLLVLPDHRSPETHGLIKHVGEWTLLTAAGHDGVVAAYRALKGLCGDTKPNLSVSVFGAADANEIAKTTAKLAGVCEQFLKSKLAAGPVLSESPAVREVCLIEATADGAADSHWPVLAALADGAAPLPAKPVVELPRPSVAIPKPTVAEPVMRMTHTVRIADDAQTVIELPDADATPVAVLKAVLAGGNDWRETPVKAPALPDAIVAVAKDGRLTLLAVARPGLGDLRPAAAAFRWMTENRALIAMAVPALSADAFAEPRLHVFVDPADAPAAAVHPLLAAGTVTVAAYRKVRWADRVGLLLEAA